MAFNIHPLHRSKSNLTWHSQDVLKDIPPFPIGPGAMIDYSILPPFPVLGRGLEYVERLILLAADREDTICALRKMVHLMMNTDEWSRRSCTTSGLLRSHGCGNRRHRPLGRRKLLLRLPGRMDCTSVLGPRIGSGAETWGTCDLRRRVDGRRGRRFIKRAGWSSQVRIRV